MDWKDCPDVERIPGKVSGQWIIKGTRILADGVIDNAEQGMTPDELVPRAGSSDSVSAGESELPRSGEIDPQASRTFGRGSRGHVVVSCRITC